MRSKMTSISLTKPSEKTGKDNKKIARTRRQRGYNWEDTLVKRFNSSENWKAFRLGSPSIALPDVLAVNNQNSMIFTIEAKSGTSTSFLFQQIRLSDVRNGSRHLIFTKIEK
ncbi:hypothetical protein EMGBD3_17400 [Nitrosarchaeum sp.]|nr:hypothetical protein EMGBD3_17400 [Nitrosarchaeum sp.]